MSYLEYAQRGENAWWRYLVSFALGLVISVALGVAILLPLMLAGLLPASFVTSVQAADQPGFYPFIGAIFAVMLIGYALAIRWVHRKRFGDVLGAWSWRGYAQGFVIWTAVLVAACLIDFLIAPAGFAFTASRRTLEVLALAAPAIAVQTFAEEFLFRGYITQGLLALTRRPLATALLSGLIFGAVHIPNGGPQAASATVFGVAMALIAIRTGGVAFTSGLHFVNNLFGAIVVVSVNDAFRGSPGVFSQNTPHLMWWDAAVGAGALVVLAAVMMRRKGSRDVEPATVR